MLNKYLKYLFHVLEPSLWTFFIAFSLFFFVTILAFTMHYVINGYYILLGLSIILITSIYWFSDIFSNHFLTIVLIPLFLILILEFGVALLQAYVFTVLVCIYLSDTEKLGVH